MTEVEAYERPEGKREDPFKTDNYWYNGFHLTSKCDGLDSLLYTYDGAGRLSSVNKASKRSGGVWYGSDNSGIANIDDGNKEEFSYAPLGRVQTIKKWKSSKSFTLHVKEYDLLDRIVEERIENEKGHILVKNRYGYDRRGLLSQVIGYPQNEERVLIQYKYDGFGRLCSFKDAFNQETTVIYDDRYVNELGQKTLKRTQIDPVGNQKEEIFDRSNNLVRVLKKDKLGQILAESEFGYNGNGSKILETSSGITMAGAFDLGNQYQFLQAKGTSDERVTTSIYNHYRELTQKFNPGSKEPIIYSYNNQGQLDSLAYQKNEHHLYYDDEGNLSKIQLNAKHSIKYEIDRGRRLLSEKVEDAWGSYKVSCTYDGEGCIETIKLPDGSKIEYTYEGPFVKTISRLVKGKSLYKHKIISRDQMGHCLEETLIGSAGIRKQGWDFGGRKTEIITDYFTDKMGYDPLHNIKKKDVTFENTKYTTKYKYDSLSQLTSEKGDFKGTYSYDSLGNRLDYKINSLNQVLEAEGNAYTYDLTGSLASKTRKGKTWIYQNNPLNHLMSIQDPDQNIITFIYDLAGKRLSKKVECKGKKTKIYRYFYLGSTELGCLDENGSIIELKVPGDPNHPETTPAIAIELRKEVFAPVYDLQGNIACLLDPMDGKIVESYRYSAFGEEKIYDDKGNGISHTEIGNPWRYRAKRIDDETGLIYFGKRYYDPQIGRWTSQDPAGTIDGPNLYTYVHNNPLARLDHFGLKTVDADCGCTHHDHPGWFNAPSNCCCICGKFEFMGLISAVEGAGHAVLDFAVDSLHDLQTASAYIGAEVFEFGSHETSQMLVNLERSQAQRMAAIDSWVMGTLAIDPADAVYQSFRSNTTLGLQIGSAVAGGYGAIKGVVAVSRLARMPMQATKVLKLGKQLKGGNGFLGHRGFELKNPHYQSLRNKAAIIQNRSYSGHALDQMQNRGLTPSVIEEAIKRGSYSIGKNPGTTAYYDMANDVTVILNAEGRVITSSYGGINQ